MAATQRTPALSKPIKVGRLTLQHRIVLAPLIRFRTYTSHVPGPRQASYYSQRGSTPGTLLIAEGTFISHDAGGYSNVPGIYTDEQIKDVGACQGIVHLPSTMGLSLGRAADIDFLEKQDPPSPYVSASSVALIEKSQPPRALTEAEIQDYIAAYAKAASNAVYRAGFDGVEVHNTNGYLPDQFLQTVSNTRTDRWGGDEEGLTRFTRGIVDAVGDDRFDVRISPWSTWQDMGMPDPIPTFAYLATALRCMAAGLQSQASSEPKALVGRKHT